MGVLLTWWLGEELRTPHRQKKKKKKEARYENLHKNLNLKEFFETAHEVDEKYIQNFGRKS
jgi:hypothetical protein